MYINPRESSRIKVQHAQRRFLQVELIQVAYKVAQTDMVSIIWRLEQVPIQALCILPLLPLSKFASHKEQLFARMAPHETEQNAQVGELLPDIPRHLREQRAFAIDDFIVRERQHKVFGIRIYQRKGDVVLMIAPVDRIQVHVIQHVMHPAHVPLQAEAQSTHIGGTSHHWPGR